MTASSRCIIQYLCTQIMPVYSSLQCPPPPIYINTSYHVAYSDRALLVFLLRNFIIKNTSPYEVIQNNAVIPVCNVSISI